MKASHRMTHPREWFVLAVGLFSFDVRTAADNCCMTSTAAARVLVCGLVVVWCVSAQTETRPSHFSRRSQSLGTAAQARSVSLRQLQALSLPIDQLFLFFISFSYFKRVKRPYIVEISSIIEHIFHSCVICEIVETIFHVVRLFSKSFSGDDFLFDRSSGSVSQFFSKGEDRSR